MKTSSKPAVREVIVVEGRYDKHRVLSAVDAVVIETGGFRAFTDEPLIALLRALSEKRGVIIMTDSDGAGFQIRNRVKSRLPADRVKHAYIPDIPGKERRKTSPSKAGKLGVEGMERGVILETLRRAGASFYEASATPEPPARPITRLDLYEDGFFGSDGASGRRAALLLELGLPELLSVSALTDVLNAILDYDSYKNLIKGLER